MRKFITKTILISLPIFILAISMEILLRNIPNDYLYKKEFLDKHAVEIETLILGSSHAFYDFNPAYFTSITFNASHNSQSLNYDLEILKKYKSNFKNLKTIVLPISYFTLFGKLEAGADAWLIKNYIIYYGLETSNSIKYRYEILSNRLNINIKRLVYYYVLKKPGNSCSEYGWGTNYNSANAKDLHETGIIAAKRHTRDDTNSEKYQNIFKENIVILNTIATWCINRNIKILFITPPAYETYRRHLNKEQLDIMVKTAESIASEYDNCEYVNLISDTCFIDKDFFDADHLTEIGAEKFSKKVNTILNDLQFN